MAKMIASGFRFRERTSSVFVLLFASLVALGCRHAEGESHPAPAPSASVTTAAKDLAPANTTRALALQKPAGSTLLDKEIEADEKQIEKNPDSSDTWILLGRAWARKARRTKDPGDWLNAHACAKMVLERETKHPLARELSAMVLLEKHAFADARDAAEQLLLEDPDHLAALGIKSDAALELGRFDEAFKAAQRMVDLKPNLPSYSRAAHLRWLQGDAQAAKSIYRAALDAKDPRDLEPHAWMLVEAAMIFGHEGDVEGAEKGFDKALEVVSDDPYALSGKARVVLAQGDAKKAAEHAARAEASSPSSEAAWILGDAHAAAGDVARAEEAYTRLVDRGRNNDKRTLALFYATKDRERDEALRLAREEAPIRQDLHTRDVLAWPLYRKGDFAAARVESDAALALGTREPMLLYHAGAIRLAQGEKKGGEKARRRGAMST